MSYPPKRRVGTAHEVVPTLPCTSGAFAHPTKGYSAAFIFGAPTAERYHSRISAPFQCSTPSKRFT